MADEKPTKQGNRLKDISGQQFGRYTVVSYAGDAKWNCVCQCGIKKVVIGANLRNGLTNSCGCLRSEIIRASGYINKGNIREWRSWCSAKNRCFNPSADRFKLYGGRGITMCEEWHYSFQAFFDYMGPRPPRTSLDRIDNDGNYEPGNCRWATQKEQVRNQSTTVMITHEGQTKPIAELAEITGISYKVLKYRYLNSEPLFTKRRRWERKAKYYAR